MSFESDEEDERDVLLRAIGPSLVGRVRSGEVGIFASIDVQTQVMDAMLRFGDEPELQPLKQIFAETKVVRARAHKIHSLVNERIAVSLGQGTARPPAVAVHERQQAAVIAQQREHTPEPARPLSPAPKEEEDDDGDHGIKVFVTKKRHQDEEKTRKVPEPAPKTIASNQPVQTDALQDFAALLEPLEYRLADWLLGHGATVRIREAPDGEAPVVGVVDANTRIEVGGMTSKWFKVEKPVDGWALRAAPDGRSLFQQCFAEKQQPSQQQAFSASPAEETVSIEEFRALKARVSQLEAQVERLLAVLRNV